MFVKHFSSWKTKKKQKQQQQIRERLTDPNTIITNHGDGNSNKCGSTAATCYGIKYKCGNPFYPRTVYSCSETGTSINDQYCSFGGRGNCNIYHSPPGCDECSPPPGRFFKKSYNHPCVDCQSIFGNACYGCNDAYGCCQCADGFGVLYDAESQMWYCHPTPCLNPDYNCRVCNWYSTATYCSQCENGFNTMIGNEYCI